MVTMGGCGGVQGGRWILLPQKDNNELVIAFFFAILKLYTPQAPTPRNKTTLYSLLYQTVIGGA